MKNSIIILLLCLVGVFKSNSQISDSEIKKQVLDSHKSYAEYPEDFAELISIDIQNSSKSGCWRDIHCDMKSKYSRKVEILYKNSQGNKIAYTAIVGVFYTPNHANKKRYNIDYLEIETRKFGIFKESLGDVEVDKEYNEKGFLIREKRKYKGESEDDFKYMTTEEFFKGNTSKYQSPYKEITYLDENIDSKKDPSGEYYYYKNGDLNYEILKDGKPKGKYIRHFESRKKWVVTEYDKDLDIVSESVFYENGQLKEKGNYKNKGFNKTDEWAFYFKNGQIKEIGMYKDDNKIGQWKEAINVKDDVDFPEFENEELFKSSILSNIGEYIYRVGTYRDGEDEMQDEGFKAIYDSGEIFRTFSGRKIKYYFRNGNIMIEGKYDSDGYETGKWKVYKENGSLLFEENVTDY
ncbi:MAG: hypothetical protein COA67_05700 [Lutibacter sp.]|nr:MAG: hypothetical protein COA67_05700 [Lutibacter sp.]